ncbi:AraC family transcriptional regulator ligand-binding domain-containing protein [Novosphingobium sp. PhB165]|uniref:AraC family transcriptional regulator n=1 Tax=Novosphingobium sp. PhB165 TaxID=2485105 RepID=UPI00104E7F84|nr:AraC family transcriptional regulator ligand-binding domain-containing protein [Novosphingobium sp. PhB165]
MTADIGGSDFERLNAPLLRHFTVLVTELGGDLPALLREVGIPPHSFSECSGVLTYTQAIRLLDIASRRVKCRDLGMRLALRQCGGAGFGTLGNVMRNSKTFGDALRSASEHCRAHSRAARVWLSSDTEHSTTFAGHELLLSDTANRAQLIEQILLIGHLEALEMTGGFSRARRVHFRHEPVSSPALYRRNFGCDVLFGEPADGITFSSEDLSHHVINQDAYVYRDMIRHLEENFPKRGLPVDAEVRGLVLRSLAMGDSSSDSVAQALNLNPRTLRRRLRHEGLSFQELKDEIRCELTRYYLERTDLEFREISERLGFAEQSIFSRSCRRWFGKSPTEFKSALCPRDEPVRKGQAKCG